MSASVNISVGVNRTRINHKPQTINPRSTLTEDSVLSVQPFAGVETDEELRLVGVGRVLVGHGHLPAVVELDTAVRLVLERPAPD